MKLIFCARCRDVLKMTPPTATRTCLCGRSSGHYLTNDPDETRSVISGPARVIAIDNTTLYPIMLRVCAERADNIGLDRYVGRDDYWLKENELNAWVFGPNAQEVTRNTTAKTPRTVSARESRVVRRKTSRRKK